MAFTSGRSGAGSDTNHHVRLNVNGRVYGRNLDDLPGDDYQKNRGDLWKMHINRFVPPFILKCVKPEQIRGVSLAVGSDDSWGISDVATFVSFDNNGKNAQLLSVNFNAYKRLSTQKNQLRNFKLNIRRC